MNIHDERYRDQLLKGIASRMSYVTYTPFIYVGQRRAGVELYTTINYSKEEVLAKIDTDNAADYIAATARELDEYIAAHREEDITPWLSCELSFFVDERVRTDKSFRPNGLLAKDILDGINCLTVYSPDYENKGLYQRRTFVVDLDALDDKLWEAGFETNMYSFDGPSSKYAKEQLVMNGPDSVPYVTAWKGRRLRETEAKTKSLT